MLFYKKIAKRYKKQHSKCYKAPHIIVFIENIENFVITHFETLKNIFEISQKVGIYFVLSIGKIEKKHYFKLLGLCNYLLIVADNLVLDQMFGELFSDNFRVYSGRNQIIIQ